MDNKAVCLSFPMRQHKQVQVQVNAFVDEGVADLVKALSRVPGLVTLESCQGGDGQDAFVLFTLGGWKDAGGFLFECLLPAMSPDLRSTASLRLRAYDEEMAQGEISIDPRAISSLVQCITNLDLRASVGTGVLMTGDAHRDTVAQAVVTARSN